MSFNIILFPILTSISIACNYVGPAKWTDYDNMYDRDSGVREPQPVNFCATQTNGTHSYSRMFLCAPWGLPYVFIFDSIDCKGDPSVSGIEEGDWECDSDELCNVFHVRSTELNDGDSCAFDSQNYGEYITLADQCVTTKDGGDGSERLDSFMATCDSSTNYFEYKAYRGVSDCSGAPNMTISGVSGTCHVVEDDNDAPSYIELVNCGAVSPIDLNPAAETCSFIRNASYTEKEEYFDGQNYHINERKRVSEEERPLDHELCLNEFRDGSFSAQLWFCSEAMGRAWKAEWHDRSTPSRCNTAPDDITIFDESEAGNFECSDVNGACPYVFFRVSGFEDEEGEGVCRFGDNYHEMTFTTDTCWSGRDAAKAVCSGSDLIYSPYEDLATCESGGASVADITLSNGVCYVLDGDEFGTEQTAVPGNYTFFQLLSCNGNELNPRPQCKFIENAIWEDPEEKKQREQYQHNGGDKSCPDCNYDYDRKTGDGFKEPIGICISEMKNGGESYMYLCPPFGDDIAPVVAVWDGTECGANGNLLYITDTVYTDYSCSGSCDKILWFQMNRVSDAVTDCKANDTHWGQKAFLPGCTMSMEYDENGTVSFGATSIACDATTGVITYEVYSAPGCSGTPMGITVDTSSAAPCSDTGDEAMYFDLLQCGPNTAAPGDECSYIVNPVYNNSYGREQRDGAIPLSTELCYSDTERGSASEQFFCDFHSGLAFIAIWNESVSCSGFPDEIFAIESAVDDMVCAADDVSNCQYVDVSLSNIPLADECEAQTGFDSAARILNKCWPGTDRHRDSSWKVNCIDDTAMIKTWNSSDCTGAVAHDITVKHNECSESFGDSDEKTLWKINYCSAQTADSTTEEPQESTQSTEVPTDGTTTGTAPQDTGSTETSAADASSTTQSGETTESETCQDDEADGFCFAEVTLATCKKTNRAKIRSLAAVVDVCEICIKSDADHICVCEAVAKSDLSMLPNKLNTADIRQELLDYCWDNGACDSFGKISKKDGASACECESLECDGAPGTTPVDIGGESSANMDSVAVVAWIPFIFYAMRL